MESMEGHFSSFGASVESITKSLEEKDLNEEVISKKISAVSDVISSNWMQQFEGYFSKQPQENFRMRIFSKQLEEVCIGLWNKAVARYTARTLAENLNTSLRQLCCDLIACPLCRPYGISTSAADNKAYLHRRIMMETKTGKSWLNQCNFEKALHVLLKGKEDVKSLHEILTQEKQPDENVAPQDEFLQVYKYKIKVLTLLSETFFGQQSLDEAISCCCEATALPYLYEENFTSDLHQLAVLTYNFAVKCFQKQLFVGAIKWLQSSVELWKKMPKLDEKQLSQTLRLLAHAFHETELEENIPKALKAIDESNLHSPHPSGILLKLKIVVKFKTGDDDVIKELLSELLHHKELQVDLGLDACSFLNNNKRYDFCEFGLGKLLSRFAGSQHVGRVHAQRLQAAIERLPPGDAVDYVEKYLEDESIVKSFDEKSQKLVQLLLWEQAAKRQGEGDLLTCLLWYNISLQLFNSGGGGNSKERSDNISKLFRNKAACLIRLNRLDEAEEMAKLALDLNPDSIYSLFTAFKVFVMQERAEKAIEAVNRMTGSLSPPSGDIHTFTCLAAQLAFERNQREVAMVTLAHLARNGKDDSAKLVALRCLVRLHLTMTEEEETDGFHGDDNVTMTVAEPKVDVAMDVDVGGGHVDKAVSYIREAFGILENLKSNNLVQNNSSRDSIVLPGNESHLIGEENFDKEVTWFMKVAWNLALRNKDNSINMRNMFSCCSDLLALLPQEGSVLCRRQTCLLMSAASGLEVVRSGATDRINTELQNVLNIIDRCQIICEKLRTNGTTSIQNDKTVILMSLYRYEALCKLLPPSGEIIPEALKLLLDKIAEMKGVDEKTFESLAALSVEPPAKHTGLYKMAVERAIGKIGQKLENGGKEMAQNLINKRCVLSRMLIERLLSEASLSEEKVKCWNLFNEIHAQNAKHKLPETELLWLMVKSWNIGVGSYVSDKLNEAERWTCLAMRFLTTIPNYKEAYDTHMNEIYQKILASKRNAEDIMM